MSRMQTILMTLLVAYSAALGLGEGIAQAGFYGVLAACLLTAVMKQSVGEDLRALWRQAPIRWLLAYCAWNLVTIFFSAYGPARFRFTSKLPLLLALPVTLWAFRLIQNRQAQRYVIYGLVSALAASSLLGVFQYWLGADWFADVLHIPAHRRQILVEINHAAHVAAGGFFFSRIKFSQVLLVGLPFAAYWLVTARHLKERVVAAAAYALLMVAQVLTLSRSALAATFAGAGVGLVVLMLPRAAASSKAPVSRRALAVGGFGFVSALIAVWAFVPLVSHRLQTMTHAGAYSDRFFIWSRALEMWRDHWLLGVGFGNYSDACQTYYNRVDPLFPMRTQAHDQFLTMLTEAGPLSVLLFGAFLLSMLSATWRGNSATRFLGVMLLGSFGVIALTHDPLFHVPVLLANMTAWAVVLKLAADEGGAFRSTV